MHSWSGARREKQNLHMLKLYNVGRCVIIKDMTAGLCEYVFKSTMYSAELFLERTKLVNFLYIF